jgi:hypothetical protein
MIRSLLLLLLACLYSLSSGAQPQHPLPDTLPPGRESVQALLRYVLEAPAEERARLTYALLPSREDCEAIFTPDFAAKVFRYQRHLWRKARIIVRPLMDQQTDLLLWRATTEQLESYTGEARYFQGGYRELTPYLKEGITFYRFKFIEPGRKVGSAYDSLVYVNGHWRLIHRPWQVLF